MMPFSRPGNVARLWELGSPYLSLPWSRFPCGALSCGFAISFGRVGLASEARYGAVALDPAPLVYLAFRARWRPGPQAGDGLVVHAACQRW
jgi:hypothetical protein